jgi:ketosteroid isomerase-like protein
MRVYPVQPLSLATLAILLAACSQPRTTTATRERADSVAVDKQAEERTIRGLEQRWRQAVTAKDSAAIGRFYAEDGYYLPQGSDGYEGPGSIGARWVSEPLIKLEREPKRIEVADAGDMAYEVGTYEVSWEEAKNRRGQASGNYVTIWKKVGGEWKTAAYIWNRGPEE